MRQPAAERDTAALPHQASGGYRRAREDDLAAPVPNLPQAAIYR